MKWWLMKCDHCRGHLGGVVQPYWRMRFCSKSCQAEYLQRLNANTRKKLAERNPRLAG
jgi:hypothetical protein